MTNDSTKRAGGASIVIVRCRRSPFCPCVLSQVKERLLDPPVNTAESSARTFQRRSVGPSLKRATSTVADSPTRSNNARIAVLLAAILELGSSATLPKKTCFCAGTQGSEPAADAAFDQLRWMT